MTVEARGLPVHTRSLSVALHHATENDVEMRAQVLDLRKRGVVPVGGYLQGTGIIHQMHLDGMVDRGARRYRSMKARMPSVAFEPTVGTGGESCRDRIDDVGALAGLDLADGYARGVRSCIGGVLGCSHILTLAQLAGPTVLWALDHDSPGPRAAGERLFRRDVTIDGFVDGDDIVLLAQLNDLHFAPEAESETTPDTLRGQTEVRVLGTLSLDGMRIRDVAIEERRRTLDTLESAQWRSRTDRAAELEDECLAVGFTPRVLERFGEPGNDHPLLDTVLMLAPGSIQCLASYRDTWTAVAESSASEMGGHTDSCYMWRSGGALERRRQEAES